jgi:AcrR family transcriptional regulator
MHSQQGDDRTLQQLWGLVGASTRGPKARFTVRDVTTAACRLADDEGLASLSLARVASTLGLTTTALYRYVDSKEALIDLMTDQAIGSPPELHGQDWKQEAQSWVRTLSLRYMEHRWLAEIQVSGMPRHPNRLHWMNSLLLTLDRGAVHEPLHIALLLDSLARAFAAISPSTAQESPPLPTWLSDAVRDRYPRIARELGRDWTDGEVELTRAVETALSR